MKKLLMGLLVLNIASSYAMEEEEEKNEIAEFFEEKDKAISFFEGYTFGKVAWKDSGEIEFSHYNPLINRTYSVPRVVIVQAIGCISQEMFCLLDEVEGSEFNAADKNRVLLAAMGRYCRVFDGTEVRELLASDPLPTENLWQTNSDRFFKCLGLRQYASIVEDRRREYMRAFLNGKKEAFGQASQKSLQIVPLVSIMDFMAVLKKKE
jgi:hypothetical protein